MMARALVGLLALALMATALWRLEGFRAGLEIRSQVIADTPLRVYRQPGAEGPAVVIAHGFAGSRRLMEAWALTLARAGYQAVTFDFEGHGAHPAPLSGDVDSIEGTTRLLVAQTRRVMAFARTLPGGAARPVALLGHSMASDIIIRTALVEPLVESPARPLVAISAFSQAVTATEPADLLLISGEWEPQLRAAALAYLRLVAPGADEGDIVTVDGVVRGALVAPHVEHVGVLYSRPALAAALAWLDRAYGRTSPAGAIAATGPWILLLLAGSVLLAWPLAGLVRREPGVPVPAGRTWWLATLVPALLTPLLLSLVEIRFLPVLVADYLAVHLGVYGLIALGILRAGGVAMGGFRAWPMLLLLAWGLGVCGVLLDRYAAAFMPHAARWPIIAAIAAGAIPYMLADAMLSAAGRAPLWRRLLLRIAFLASLGLAVALDFDGLMFLLIIAPVIVLFWLVYGTAAGFAGRRCGQPLVTGTALGLILAWAIGVSFPLFAG